VIAALFEWLLNTNGKPGLLLTFFFKSQQQDGPKIKPLILTIIIFSVNSDSVNYNITKYSTFDFFIVIKLTIILQV